MMEGIKKVMHPDAVKPHWVQLGRVHAYYIGAQVAGTGTLSPVGTKPTTYTWAIDERGETGTYKGLGNAKRKVELKIFEQRLDSREAKRKGKHDG